MRLWTLHPKYLDAVGLAACWRETLLAQKVLQGGTRGYRTHPQLVRFRACTDPAAGIGRYLSALHAEAKRRGYAYDETKIVCRRPCRRIAETEGQLRYEWAHLLRKLKLRNPALYRKLSAVRDPQAHPVFRIVPGDVREWERLESPPP